MSGTLAQLSRGLLCLVLFLPWTSLTWAQSSPGEEGDILQSEELARKAMHFGHEGLRFYAEKKWGQAADAFEEAEALAHSPVFVLYAARAHTRLQDHDRALFFYRICAAESLSADSPAPWNEAVRSARRELLKLEAETSGVRLVLDGNWTWPVTLHLSGRDLKIEEAEINLARAPGHYLVRAMDREGKVASQEWEARAGRHNVVIVLSAGLPPSDEQSLRTQGFRADAPPFWSPQKKAAIASFSAGGLSLIAGAIAGVVAVSESQKLKDACNGSLCPVGLEYRRDSALRAGRLATVGLVVAGVGAVTGTVLWILPDGSSASLSAGPSLLGARLWGHF